MRLTAHFKKLLGANFLVAFLGVATGVILARNLSVENRGELAEILLWVGFGVTVGSESIREYCLSFSSTVSKVSYQVLAVAAAISFLLPLVFLLDNHLGQYIIYSLLFSGINIVTILYLAKVQLVGDFSALSRYKLVVPSLNFLLLLATFFYQLDIWFALISLLLANFSLLIWVLIKEPKLEITRNSDIRSYLNVLFSICVITTIAQMDRMIMAKVSTANEMAYFIIALTIIATPLTIIAQTMSSYLVIDIKKQQSNINRYIDLRIGLLLVVLSVIAGSILLFSEWIIIVVFGDKYLPALAYGLLCAGITIMNNIRTLYNYALRGLGLNKLVSTFQVGMLSTLLLIFLVYLKVELSVISTLWLMIALQTLYFIGFYLHVRFKYLTQLHE